LLPAQGGRFKFRVVPAKRGYPLMYIIAEITAPVTVRAILAHLGEPTPPRT